jgi:hypothetical protein
MEMLMARNQYPSLSVVARAMGEVLKDTSLWVILYVNAREGKFLKNDGQSGFIAGYNKQYSKAMEKWGIQLNTCIHVVAD